MTVKDFDIVHIYSPDAIMIYDVPPGTHSDKLIMFLEARLSEDGAPSSEILHIIQKDSNTATVVVFADYRGKLDA